MIANGGLPVAVIATGNRVQVWVQSPTGDSSDSHIFEIPCGSEIDAWRIMLAWRKAWNLEVTHKETLEFSRSIHPAGSATRLSPELLG